MSDEETKSPDGEAGETEGESAPGRSPKESTSPPSDSGESAPRESSSAGKTDAQGDKAEGFGKELSLVGHLEELRTRLIWCIGALVLFTILGLVVAKSGLELLIRPVTRAAEASSVPVQADDETPAALVFVVEEDGTVRVKNPSIIPELAGAEGPPDFRVELAGAEPGEAASIALNPPEEARSDLIYTHPLDPFMMPLRVALIIGILLSIAVWVWQIWLFVAPGLTEKEKKVVKPLLLGAIFLFPVGAGFAYLMFFMLIPVMQGYAVEGIETLFTIRDYLKLMTSMMIAFGFIFELPVLVAVLSRIGVLTPAFLTHYRRHIYVGLAVLAMIATPADPFSMIAALIPLIVLFEISIRVSMLMEKLRQREEAEEAGGGS